MELGISSVETVVKARGEVTVALTGVGAAEIKQCLGSGTILKIESINIHGFVRRGLRGEEAIRYVNPLPSQRKHALRLEYHCIVSFCLLISPTAHAP